MTDDARVETVTIGPPEPAHDGVIRAPAPMPIPAPPTQPIPPEPENTT